jgi:hypothetical protein
VILSLIFIRLRLNTPQLTAGEFIKKQVCISDDDMDNESILKHLKRKCVKGTIFLWVNFGERIEEGQ